MRGAHMVWISGQLFTSSVTGKFDLCWIASLLWLIVLCVGESKAPPVLYPSYSTVYVEARAIQHGTIDNTALGYASCCIAISTTPLVPLLRVQHFLPCFNYYIYFNARLHSCCHHQPAMQYIGRMGTSAAATDHSANFYHMAERMLSSWHDSKTISLQVYNVK